MIPTAPGIARGAAQFFESELELPTGRINAATRAAKGQPFTLALQYTFQGLPGGRPPTWDELNITANQNPVFAKRWTELNKERDDSVMRGSATDEDEAAMRRLALERGIRAELTPIVAAENARRARMAVPLKYHTGAPSGLPPIDLEQEVRNQVERQLVPGVTRPPLSKEEIAAAGWDFLQQQGAEDQAKLPFVAQKLLGGAGKGVQVAATMVPVGRALEGAGLIARSFAQGAAASAAQQGLAAAGGSKEGFSVGKAIGEGLTMTAAGGVGKLAGGLTETAKGAAETIGTLGTLEAAGAAGRAGQEPSGRSTWKDFAGHVLESAATIGVAGAFGAGRQSEQRPTAERLVAPAEESAPRLGPPREQVFDPNTFEAQPPPPPRTDYQAAKETASAIGDRLRRLFRQEPKGTDYSGAITKEFLPEEMAVRRAGRAVQEFVEEIAPGDKAQQEQIRLSLQRVIEDPAVADQIKKPPEFERGLELMRKFWNTALKPGEKMAKYGLYGSTFGIDPETLNAKPIGGMAFHKERGGYLPQNVEGAPEVPREAGPPPGPPANPSSRESMRQKKMDERAPLSGEKVRGHLNPRTMTLEQKIEAGIPVDQSHGAVMSVLTDEFGAARKAARIELARADGKFVGPEDIAAGAEPPKGFIRLEGPEWSKRYEGGYLDPSVWKTARAERIVRSPTSQLLSTLISKSKRAMVVYTPYGWLRDTIGNMRKATQLGLPMWPYLEEKVKAVKPAFGEKARDPLDEAFFTLKAHANMGSSADVAAEDSPTIARLKSRIQKAKETKQGVVALYGTLGIEKAAQAVGKLPGVRKIPHIRNSLVDEADMLAAFRTAVKYGIDDSGPMTPEQAFDAVVRPLWDYGTLPRAVQATTPLFTYVRWRAKTIQSLGTAALAKPSLYGFTVPEPFTSIIRDNPPESAAAQGSLAARATMRIALHAAEWVAPMVAAQQAQLASLGKTKKELDAYLDKKWEYLPDSVRWLMKQTYIPTSWKEGVFDGLDGSTTIPELEAIKYLLPSSNAPLLWQLGEKQVLFGIGQEIQGDKDFGGHVVPHGTLGERIKGTLKPIASRFVPGFRTGESIVNEIDLPPDERDWLGLALKNAGVPMTKAAEPGAYDPQIAQWLDQGVIGWGTNDDGTAHLYVRDPEDEDGIATAAEARVYLRINKYTSEATLNRYLKNKIEGQIERAGMR